MGEPTSKRRAKRNTPSNPAISDDLLSLFVSTPGANKKARKEIFVASTPPTIATNPSTLFANTDQTEYLEGYSEAELFEPDLEGNENIEPIPFGNLCKPNDW